MFYRRSFATVTSLLRLRNCIRFADVQHPTAPTRLRSKFCRDLVFFFYSNLCDIELDDTQRA
jgi:hypothetical protein